MCGITGFWKPAGLESNASSTLARMMTMLHHRGPDGSGQKIRTQQGLAMGHTRLSIIDLSTAGQQPLSHEADDIHFTINGELYDYKTERARLSCQGENFSTRTDSEIGMTHYRREGLDFVNRLRGEFAFALFDGKKRRLVLGRDRFGIRPLFFHVKDNAIYWGSEAKSLLQHPDVPRKMSVPAALNQMMHTMVPGTSAFEGIESLKPGHLLIVEQDGERLRVKTHKYWDMDFPLLEEHALDADPEPYIDGVRDHLIDAVRVRLEADVPVGCYLSGGIDSCSILGLSTAMQQSAVKAFTISFDHAAYDESAIATEMAMKTGADQEILKLTAAELYGDSYVQTLWNAERTFYNTLGVAKWHMSKRVRECGFKVVVTGEGSDEMFGGYPFFKRDYFMHGPEVGSEGSAHLAAMDKSNALFKGAILSEGAVHHAAFDELVGFTPSWIQPWILTLGETRGLLSQQAQEALAGYDPIAAIAEQLDSDQMRGRHPLDKVQYTWIKTMLETQILNWGGDRVDMANSMESRPPFLDHHLAEFARTIPPAVRIRNGIEKWVLREAMKDVLPEVLYKREKFAFMAPPASTDRKKSEAIRTLVETWMSPEHVDALGIFDSQKVSQFLEGYWRNEDAVVAKRNDIIVNHLLGLHVLNQKLAPGSAL